MDSDSNKLEEICLDELSVGEFCIERKIMGEGEELDSSKLSGAAKDLLVINEVAEELKII